MLRFANFNINKPLLVSPVLRNVPENVLFYNIVLE